METSNLELKLRIKLSLIRGICSVKTPVLFDDQILDAWVQEIIDDNLEKAFGFAYIRGMREAIDQARKVKVIMKRKEKILVKQVAKIKKIAIENRCKSELSEMISTIAPTLSGGLKSYHLEVVRLVCCDKRTYKDLAVVFPGTNIVQLKQWKRRGVKFLLKKISPNKVRLRRFLKIQGL